VGGIFQGFLGNGGVGYVRRGALCPLHCFWGFGGRLMLCISGAYCFRLHMPCYF